MSGMIEDQGKLHLESSVNGAAWLAKVSEIMRKDLLVVEFVPWDPNITIVVEG